MYEPRGGMHERSSFHRNGLLFLHFLHLHQFTVNTLPVIFAVSEALEVLVIIREIPAEQRNVVVNRLLKVQLSLLVRRKQCIGLGAFGVLKSRRRSDTKMIDKLVCEGCEEVLAGLGRHHVHQYVVVALQCAVETQTARIDDALPDCLEVG